MLGMLLIDIKEKKMKTRKPIVEATKNMPKVSFFLSETVDHWKVKALKQIDKGDYEGAIKSYKILLKRHKLNPNDSLPCENIAVCYQALGNHAQAMYWNKKAIEVNPTSYFAFFNTAVEEANHHHLYESLKLFRKAEKINPNDKDVIRNIAEIKIEIAKEECHQESEKDEVISPNRWSQR